MKRFLRDIALFTLPLLAAAALWFIWYLIVGTVVGSRMEKIAQNEVLIMGDSQMQRINPEYFTSPAYNFASSAEHYYFTYHKLRIITSFSDNKVKSVILGLSAHTFCPVYSRLFDIEYPEGKKSLERYFYFIEGDKFIDDSDYLDLGNLKRVVLSRPYWGGLFSSENSNPGTEVIDKAYEMHYGGDDTDNGSNQIRYLAEIVSLCRENGIELYLVSTPYHPDYQRRVDEKYFHILSETLRTLGDVNYINYMDTSINTDLMSDGNHLNTTGAAIYSRLLNEAVNK